MGLNTHLQNQIKSNAHKQNWFECNSSKDVSFFGNSFYTKARNLFNIDRKLNAPLCKKELPQSKSFFKLRDDHSRKRKFPKIKLLNWVAVDLWNKTKNHKCFEAETISFRWFKYSSIILRSRRTGKFKDEKNKCVCDLHSS